jgi:deazaflavin-dependent oxidoreductase (nitroreductase family)
MDPMPTVDKPRALIETRRFKVMRRVVGALNPLMRRLLDSRFSGRMARQLLLLEFLGRKSGRTFRTPVGYVRRGDRVVMVTSPAYTWWHNLVGGAPVRVRLPDGWRRAQAEVVMPDDPRYDEVVALQVSGRGPGMLRGFGLAVDDAGHISPEAKATATQHAHLVLVELEVGG